MVTPATNNPFPSILVRETAAPAAPVAGDQRLYIDPADHLVKMKDSSGTIVTIGPVTPVGITRSTLGTTSVGGSFDTAGVKLKKVTLATAGLLASINAYMKGNGSTILVVSGVLYSDSSGAPTNVLAATNPVYSSNPYRLNSLLLNTTGRWVSFPVGRWLAAGDYWIGVHGDDPTHTMATFAYAAGSGSDRTIAPGVTAEPADSSLQAISTGTNDYSIYADVLR